MTPTCSCIFVLLSLQTAGTLGKKLRDANNWGHIFKASIASEKTIKKIITKPPLTIIYISKRSKGNDIELVKDGKIGFWTCHCALIQSNDCLVAVCNGCHHDLLDEHGITNLSQTRGRKYKFPGCQNHSYKELEFTYDEDGAYWCDPAWKNTIHADPRPRGCILCLRPFKFSTGNKKRRSEKN